jgi:two-component system cell cycle response regulator DivK
MSKVLVVEDNVLNLKLLYDLLFIKSHNILCCKDGGVVEEIVKKEKPDLILMDIQLHDGVSGLDVVATLKNDPSTKHIPIIVITAFAMKHDEIKIANSGCDMHLSKPVSIDNFFAAVEKYV